MPCSLCARPYGDSPGQCRDPETWACKDAQIERLRTVLAGGAVTIPAGVELPPEVAMGEQIAVYTQPQMGWREIGVGADPAIGQWCVLYDGDSGATYPYQVVRAEAEEWGSVRPLAYWNRHAGDRWLPLEAP